MASLQALPLFQVAVEVRVEVREAHRPGWLNTSARASAQALAKPCGGGTGQGACKLLLVEEGKVVGSLQARSRRSRQKRRQCRKTSECSLRQC